MTADFDTWAPPRAGYDGVVAFTAFHWLDPETRFARAATLLREDGLLGVVTTRHVLPPDGDPFFVEVQEDYEAVRPYAPSTQAGPPGPPELVSGLGDEIAASGLFVPVASHRRTWDVVYTADEYVDVLATYSEHLAEERGRRERLLGLIRRRVAARPGGTVRKTYLGVLDVARRIASDAD